MKRLLAVLSCCSLLFASVGCKNAISRKGGDANIIELASFEGYEEIKDFRMMNHFGAIAPVREREYVTDGNYALRVDVSGNHLNPNNFPSIGILTGSDGAVGKTDFEDVKTILLDVYNANDTDANVYFQYLTKTKVGMKLSSRNGVTVPAKTKTTVKFVLERDILANLLNLKSVSQLRIVFDNQTEYGQPTRTFYIDNLRAETTKIPIDANVKVRKEHEIESANKEDYLAAWQNMNSYNFAPSSLTYNSDKNFVHEGEGSFKMTNVIGFIDSTGGATYGGGWKMEMPFNDLSGYKQIEFWVYVNCQDAVSMFTLNAKEDEYVYLGIIQPNQWTQCVVPIEDFGTTEELKEFNYFYVGAGFPNTVTCDIYFDDIRAVKAE